MRNLKLLSSIIAENNILKGAECFCVGKRKKPDNSRGFGNKDFCDTLYVYCNNRVYCLDCNDADTCSELFNVQDYYKTDNVQYASVNIEYNYINDSILLALKNGDIFSFEWVTNSIDCIGSVDSGLKAMGFSPDLEVVVFATGEDTVILMDGLFNPIIEVQLNSNDQGENQMVNVGWGKKETQFHGSEGKSAAKAKPITDINGISNVQDDRCTRITWREDSSLFAVSFWSELDTCRKIKIYNNSGKLQCNSELLPGLEQTISWRPSGNLIAFGQTFPQKHVIGFLEKNGLRHGEFVLPSEIEVKEICWNADSTIMCLVSENSVQLWTVNNYHWYLKQQLNFPDSSNVVSVKWHTESSYKMLILLSTGRFYIYQWMWTIDRSSAILDEDEACVAVIDGSKVLLTCFKKSIIPPPMSSYTIDLNNCINAVTFFDGTESSKTDPKVNDFIAYLSDGTMAIVRLEKTPTIQKFKSKFDCLRHLLWISPKTLVCCVDNTGKSNQLCKMDINFDESIITSVLSSPLDFVIRTMTYSTSHSNQLIIHSEEGYLYNFDLGEKEIPNTHSSELETVLEKPCNEISVCEGKKNDTIVTLDSWHHLFCQGDLISSKTTSFFIQPPYLIFTTSEHELFVYKIGETSSCKKVSSRKLERGSRIVTVFNDTVVLQLPRGNLETIQPRALVLRTVASLLEKLGYEEAFRLMRRQRIHLNLFVDHHPQVFLLTAAKFIQRINDPTHLNIFLTELNENEDVTRTIYSDFYDQDKRPPVLSKKLNTVCCALREAMIQNSDGGKYLLPILTTHVRTGEMLEALKIASTSNQALHHLLFLVDIDKLYDKAISLYDIDMALKIAAESRKDPKEYFPYLNGLKKLDPIYMKFTIDCQYKNYESALRNISTSTDDQHFSEALDLIQMTSLYPLSLDLYRGNAYRYKMVASKYAGYLYDRKCFEEAALMFLRSGDHEQALRSYVKCGLWRDAVTLSRKLNHSEEEQRILGEALFESLRCLESWVEAAAVAQELLQDKRLTIECLVNAKLWNRAVYLANQSAGENVNYLETMVIPYLRESANSMIDEIKQNSDKLDRFASRLAQVRFEKTQKKENLSGDIDVNDLQSEASSTSSWSSRSSGSHTSKSTRKLQRKMWSLKEGNPREEFALLSVITQLIQGTEKMTSEVMGTCSELVKINEVNLELLACRLQNTLTSALEAAAKLRKSVWPLQPGTSEEGLSLELADSQLRFPPASCICPHWKTEMLEFNIT